MFKNFKLFLLLFLVGFAFDVKAENYEYQKMYLTSHHLMSYNALRDVFGRANLHILEDLDTASSREAGDGVTVYAYCADVDTGGYQGTYVKSVIADSDYNGNGAKMRAILSSSYPFVTLDEMKLLYKEQMGADNYNKNNISGLTYQEAIYATQAAVWTISNPNRVPYSFAGNMDDSDMLVLHHNRLNIDCDWSITDPNSALYCYPSLEATKYETDEILVSKRLSAVTDWLLSIDNSLIDGSGSISIDIISKTYKYDSTNDKNVVSVSFKVNSDSLTMVNSLSSLNVKVTDMNGNDIKVIYSDGVYTVSKEYANDVKKVDFDINVSYTGRYGALAYLFTSSGNQDLVSATSKSVTKEAKEKVTLSDETGTVEVSKVSVTGGAELPGAKLQIHDSEGNLIDEWISGDKVHVVKGLVDGNYTLTEVIAPEGYATATTIKFVIEKGKVTKVAMIDEVTKVLISKKDFTTEEEVVGAKIEIRDLNGKVIDSWTSSSEPHYIEKLAVGKYVLVETVYPNGYQENMIIDGIVTTEYEFEVRDTGEIQTIDVYNRIDTITDVPSTGIHKSILLGLLVIAIGGSMVFISNRRFVRK